MFNEMSDSLYASIMECLTEAEQSGQMDQKTEDYLHFMVGQSHHDFDNYEMNHGKTEIHESGIHEQVLSEAFHPDDIIASGKQVFAGEKSFPNGVSTNVACMTLHGQFHRAGQSCARHLHMREHRYVHVGFPPTSS